MIRTLTSMSLFVKKRRIIMLNLKIKGLNCNKICVFSSDGFRIKLFITRFNMMTNFEGKKISGFND